MIVVDHEVMTVACLVNVTNVGVIRRQIVVAMRKGLRIFGGP